MNGTVYVTLNVVNGTVTSNTPASANPTTPAGTGPWTFQIPNVTGDVTIEIKDVVATPAPDPAP